MMVKKIAEREEDALIVNVSAKRARLDCDAA